MTPPGALSVPPRGLGHRERGDVRRWHSSRTLWLGLVLAVSAVGSLVLVLRDRPAPVRPLPEVHRSSLIFRDGRWYAAGQGGAFTGLLLNTYGDGARRSRSAVSNGWLEGLSEGWYTNGLRQVAEHFRGGVSHGTRTKWYPDGRPLSEAVIVDGQIDGVFRRWHEDGALAEEIEMKQGKPDGVSRAYYPSGFLKAESRLRQGTVLEQKFWNDGEHSPTAATAGSRAPESPREQR